MRVAGALRRAGVGPGDRVAVALRNRVEFYEAVFGAARVGAQVVPVSWRFKADEVRYMVEDSRARLVVAEEDARATTEGLPALHLGGEYERALGGEGVPSGEAFVDVAPAIRFYTSGTTGRPKAVERPGDAEDRYLESVLASLSFFGVRGEDQVHLVCGPLYHTAPLAFSVNALLLGQTVVLPPRFDPQGTLRLIEAERVTWSMMVPIHFVRILALPEAVRTEYDLSSIRRILHAAAPCPPEVKRAIMDVFPAGAVWEFYGTTEGRATLISPEEWLRRPGSVGRAIPGVTVAVLDDDGRALPPGEVGLVYISPAGGVRFRYANAPEKTAAAWRGDLFTVGDMGYLDEDGYLFLTDRRQDVIISGGANVYPAEVEAVLHRHPAVADVAVIGVPDEEWGESVKAIVEPRAPVEPEELIRFAREHLAHYKCPRSVDLVNVLPRDPNGKISKRALREPYSSARMRRLEMPTISSPRAKNPKPP